MSSTAQVHFTAAPWRTNPPPGQRRTAALLETELVPENDAGIVRPRGLLRP
jgi:hypothetical protein